MINRVKMKQIRTTNGLTQQEIADKTGVTQAFISQLETGARQTKSRYVIITIATVLGIEPKELGGEGY